MQITAMRRVERVGRIFSAELLVGTAFVVLALVLFAAAMTVNLDYDEEQYVAGAYFARTLSLYRDFISFQPPTYTWITAAVFQVIDGWYLLTARVLTWVLVCASCVLLYSLLRSIGAGRFAAFVLLLAFIASPFMRGPLTQSRNDLMPLFFMLIGLRMYFGRDGRITAGRNGMLWSGFFLSLAAATKYSYLFAAPIAAAVTLYDEYVGRNNGRRVFASPRLGFFVLGASLGLLPLLYALAVHQDRFVFMTLHFHTDALFDWYRANGYGEMLTIGHKLRTLPAKLVQRGNATLRLDAHSRSSYVHQDRTFASDVERRGSGDGSRCRPVCLTRVCPAPGLPGRLGPNRIGVRVIPEQVSAAITERRVGLNAPHAKRARVFEPLNEQGIVEELPDDSGQRFLTVSGRALAMASETVEISFEGLGPRESCRRVGRSDHSESARSRGPKRAGAARA